MRKRIMQELAELRREVAELRREVAELRLRPAEIQIHYDHIIQPTYPTLPSPHWHWPQVICGADALETSVS